METAGHREVTITASSVGDPNLTLFEIDDSKSPEEVGWATQLDFNDDIDVDAGDYDARIVHTLENGSITWCRQTVQFGY